MSTEDPDLEREKNRSYELGHISQLENIAGELREEAGELWAHGNGRRDTEVAKKLKKLAAEYEDRAEEEREAWEEKYKSDSQ